MTEIPQVLETKVTGNKSMILRLTDFSTARLCDISWRTRAPAGKQISIREAIQILFLGGRD